MSAHDEAEALIRRADDNAMRGEGSAALIEEAQRLIGRADPEVDLHEIWGLLPELTYALEAALASRLVLGHDVAWWKAAWDKATDGKLEGYHELGRKVAAAEEARDAANAALREERIDAEGLRERLAEAERLRDAHKKAKQENDDRFIRERDDARRERDAAESRTRVAEERVRELTGIINATRDTSESWL